MSADGRAEESPQQGIQSIEVGAQVLRALEAGRGLPACWSTGRPTGWPTRSAAPPGRSRRNWDTARRNAP
ncbi:MAG TPA: hypothetical protein VJ254_24685, partial [Streptosporangiaceae bacterium]|nr:hypothetical protein [Streptosporangiaceae bacterium]